MKAKQRKQAPGMRIERAERAAEKAVAIEGGSLRERALLVRFSIGRWYGRGADDEVTEKVKSDHNAQGDVGTFTKRRMSREYLAGIASVVNEARRRHKEMTLPWGNSNHRVLSVDLFFDYKKEMTAYEMRFYQEVERFIAGFDAAKAAERKRLNGLFKESDYPSHEALRELFRFSLDIDPMPSAADFRVDLGEQELARIKSELEERVTVQMREASSELWERLHEMLAKLKERLSDSDSQLRKSLFDNVRELTALLPKLNITNDPKLNALAAQVAEDLLSDDVEVVREDNSARAALSKKADALMGAVDQFLKKGGSK